MCAHPCHVVTWALKFARSLDFARGTRSLDFCMKLLIFKWFLFLENTVWGQTGSARLQTLKQSTLKQYA